MEQNSYDGGRRLYRTRKRAAERDPARQAVAHGLGHRRAGSVSVLTSSASSLSALDAMLGRIWQRLSSPFMRN